MGSNPALRQLLSGLCDSTHWIYAVFWRLDNCSHMLTWEDGYVDSTKVDGTVSSTSNNESLGILPGIMSLDSNIHGSHGRSPMGVAVASMSYFAYSAGDGVLGKVALASKHCWFFANELESDVPLEYPEEWRVQFAAGIKTILLVPLASIGVVQLGSLDMVKEDSTIVAYIKHLFSSPHSKKLDHLNPSSLFTTPLSGPASSALTAFCPNSIWLQTLADDDPQSLDIGELKDNRSSSIDAHLLPSFMVQDDLQLSQDFIGQRLGRDTRSSADESTWKTMFEELVMDASEETDALNQATSIQKMINNNFTELYYQKEGSNDTLQADVRNSRLNPEWSIPQNSYKKDQEHGGSDLFHAKYVTDQPYANQFAIETGDARDSRFLNFPLDFELHSALHLRSLRDEDDCTRKTILSKVGYSKAFDKKTVRDSDEDLLHEAGVWCTKTNDTEYLLDAVIASLDHAPDETSDLSEKLPGSCLTECKVENDALCVDSMSLCHEKSALASNVESFKYSPSGSSLSKSITTSIHLDQNKSIACENCQRGVKPSQYSKKRGSSNMLHRARPRDRQLIQDRLKELRDLIPNGSKCSIDALLDRTIKHMLFLKSFSSRTEKLKDYTRLEAHQNGASWACELGNQSDACPLIVENLDKSGQMLVEMLCKDYGVFLEIAEVMRRLELTILKGVLESRSDELWAHFIVEVVSGFHRMDILWPLMQLLQRNDVSISRNL